jgi:hypothetical protein
VEPTVAPAPAAVAAATPAAETIDDDEPPLPGAHAKESLLLATWRRWLRAERDAFDDDVALLADHGLPAQDRNDDRTTDSAAGVDPRVDDAVARLVRGGRRALPALARGFPGRLPWPPLHGRARSLRGAPAPAPASVLGVLATLGADASAAILTGALDAADADTRAAAVMALHAIDVPAAVARLGGRVFDREARIARLAVEVLDVRRASPLFPAVAERLRDLCRRGDDDERERAIAAVAALRDIDAIGVLVQLLHVRPTTIAEAAHDALVQITRADFGFAERRWIAWHADHGREPRTRWLLRALANVDANLRRGAADDLALLGIDVHAFRFDAPPTERAAALAGIAYALGEPSP